MIASTHTMAHCAPSPPLRGEAWGQGASPRGRKQLGSRSLPLTRAFGATSPHKRGEVKKIAGV